MPSEEPSIHLCNLIEYVFWVYRFRLWDNRLPSKPELVNGVTLVDAIIAPTSKKGRIDGAMGAKFVELHRRYPKRVQHRARGLTDASFG